MCVCVDFFAMCCVQERCVSCSSRRILVGGRLVGSEYRGLDDQFPFPEGLPHDFFLDVPSFRVDLSSTEIRAGMAEQNLAPLRSDQ